MIPAIDSEIFFQRCVGFEDVDRVAGYLREDLAHLCEQGGHVAESIWVSVTVRLGCDVAI